METNLTHYDESLKSPKVCLKPGLEDINRYK